MPDSNKLKQMMAGLLISSFVFLILGLMQYFQCSYHGYFYSEGFSIKCNSFYKHGSLILSSFLVVAALILYLASSRFGDNN